MDHGDDFDSWVKSEDGLEKLEGKKRVGGSEDGLEKLEGKKRMGGSEDGLENLERKKRVGGETGKKWRRRRARACV